MSDKHPRQAKAYRDLQLALSAFYAMTKELLNEDPNDPVTLEMADLHDKSSIGFLKSIRTVLEMKKVKPNFLKVVTDENDPV